MTACRRRRSNTAVVAVRKPLRHGRATRRQWVCLLWPGAVLLRHEGKRATSRIAPRDSFSASLPRQLPAVDGLSPGSHRGRGRDGRPGLRYQPAFPRQHFGGATLHRALSLAVLRPCGGMLRAVKHFAQVGYVSSIFYGETSMCSYISKIRYVLLAEILSVGVVALTTASASAAEKGEVCPCKCGCATSGKCDCGKTCPCKCGCATTGKCDSRRRPSLPCKCGCATSGKCACGKTCPCKCGCGTTGKCDCAKKADVCPCKCGSPPAASVRAGRLARANAAARLPASATVERRATRRTLSLRPRSRPSH